MPWAWMAIRLTARSLLSEPSFSTTRPLVRPSRGARCVSTATRSPSCRLGRSAGRDGKLPAEHLLVDRLQAAAAGGERMKDAEHAVLGAVDEPDDAAAVADAGFFFRLFHAQAARGRRGRRLRRVCALRGTKMRIFGAGPCASSSHSSGVAMRSPSVSRRGHVGEQGRGQGAGVMQLLAPLLDQALVGEVAQHALELGARGVLQAEGAGDLAGADLAGAVPDEGEEVGLGRKG